MTRYGCAVVAAFAVLLATAPGVAADELITKLTVEEENGVDRVNEPMTMGMPLPEGKVAGAGLLALTDSAGKNIPSQITEVSKWLDGKSVKWVHITWNQSVKAKDKVEVQLVLRQAFEPGLDAQPALAAVEKDNTVTVQNRFVKFVVKGAKFTGFDAAWFDAAGKSNFTDATQIITSGGGSVSMAADRTAVTVADEKFVVPKDGIKTYSSANDAEGKVVIEEQGSRRIVVKATGRHMDGARKMLDYIVRFYAYADSPIVRVSHTFVGAHGTKPSDVEFMSGLYFDVPTKLGDGKLTLGTDSKPLELKAGELNASIVQENSDHYIITSQGQGQAEGKGKSTKPLTTGWLDLSIGDYEYAGKGLAVGIKWFWQMQPKSLSAAGKGLIRVGLYPLEADQPLEVYMGQSRTHYMTFVFHDAKTTAADLNNIFAGQHRPLRAWAPPKYYCRDTHCFGYSIEAAPELFGDNAAQVKLTKRHMIFR